jgi:hypothetical protein
VLRVATGSHIIEAENAVDGSTTSFAARFFIFDNVGPDVEFTGTQDVDPLTGDPVWTNMPVALSVSATDAGVGIDEVCAEGQCATDLNGDGVAELTLDPPIAADLGQIIDREVSATGTDRLGNPTTVTTRVRIDAAAPEVTITTDPAPNANDWNNGLVTYTVRVTDLGSGAARVACLSVNGAACEPITLASDGTYTATLPATSGTTTLQATATDVAGNTGTSDPKTVQIDTDAPTGAIVTIAGQPLTGVSAFDGILSFGEAATITYACNDPQPTPATPSGIATCQLLLGDTVVDSDSATGGSYTFDAKTIGTTSFTVRATDRAGNPFTTSTPVNVLVGYRTCEDYNPNQAKRAGSAYPITVRLCDAIGNTVIVPGAVLTALTVNGLNDPGPQFPGNSNEAYQFRDNGDGSYSYNVKTDGLLRATHRLYFTYLPLTEERSTLTNDELQALATNFATFSTR